MKKQFNKTNYSLDSIAGYPEEKKEAVEIINLFKHFNMYQANGVTIPKGLILSGSPGVGKTLMAKVISAESNVPFYEYEASEGNTLRKSISNIKNIYDEARKNAPSIVFIDELDELVSSKEYISDMSRIMLKTLLTEIDGVKNSDGVLTIATTNNYRCIPESLKRSGRMDRHISFDLPNLDSREAILRLYAKDKALLKNIDFKEIAGKTAGFSGADLKTLINESLIKNVSVDCIEITNEDISNLIPTITFKGIRKDLDKPPLDNVCYHELGHFICEVVLNKIIPSISTEKIGDVEGHVSIFEDYSYDAKSQSFTECKNNAIISLGGYAAEKVFMNETYTGVSYDFSKFESTIKLMAASGMFDVKDIFNYNKSSSYEYFLDRTTNTQVIGEDDIRVKCFNEYLEIATGIINRNKELLLVLFKKLKEEKKIDSKVAKEIIKVYKVRK